MAFSSLTYRTAEDSIETVNTRESLPFNDDLVVKNFRVGEDGNWVVIHYENRSSGSEGSVMIPKDRVIRIGEEREIF